MKTPMKMQPSQENTLIEILEKLQGEYRYLLLDPLKPTVSWSPLHLDHLKATWGTGALYRVPRPDLAYTPDYCPMLLLLASPGESCSEEIIRRSEEHSHGELLAEKRYICGWISTPLAPAALAQQLAELCRKIKPDAIIPFFEPLHLELLQALSNPGELASLLGPISRWGWLSCTGHLRVLTGTSLEEEWQLEWRTEQALGHVRDIWRVLSAWQQVADVLPENAVLQAVDAWVKASQVGLHHTSDCLYLALNSLTLPTDILAHKDVQALLQQAVNTPELYFNQLLLTLPDAVWQELEQ
jgi:hypothetical protein